MAKLRLESRDFKSILTNKNLFYLLFGDLISGIGNKLTTVALYAKIYLMTENAFYLSLVPIIGSLPGILFGLVAGNVVDHYSRKKVLIIVNLGLAITSMLLAFTNSLLIFYIVCFLAGTLSCFEYPARATLLPMLVQEDQLQRTNSMRSTLNSVKMIVGYAIAGAIVGFIGYKWAFIIDSLTFIFIALFVVLIKVTETHIEAKEQSVSESSGFKVWLSDQVNSIKDGVKLVVKHHLVRRLIFLDLLTTFIISMQAPLVYAFVKNYLGGAEVLAARSGLLFSCAGVGGVLGGIVLSIYNVKVNRESLLTTVLLFDGLTLLAFSNVHYFPLSLVLFTFLGVIFSIFGTIINTVIQENVNDKFLGRVYGFLEVVTEPLGIISLFIGGVTEGWFGAKMVFILCAVAEIATALIFKANRSKVNMELVVDKQ